MMCILCNLTVGWWGIPWGPIWTIKETFMNLINSNTVFWGSFAGRPVEKSEQEETSVWGQEYDSQQSEMKEDIIKETPKKKIAVKDLLIYILIGLVIAAAFLVADINGML